MPGHDRRCGDLLAGLERHAGRDAVDRRDRPRRAPRSGSRRPPPGPPTPAHRPGRTGRPSRTPSRPRRRRRCPPSRPAAPPSCPPTTAPSPCTGRRARPASRATASERERLGDVVGDRHREHPQDRATVGLAQAAERAPEPQPQQRVAEPGCPDLGRRLVAEVCEEPRERSDAAVELDERRRVVLGPGADRVDGLAEVAPQRHRPAVGLGREDADLRRDQRQPVLGERELARDRGP